MSENAEYPETDILKAYRLPAMIVGVGFILAILAFQITLKHDIACGAGHVPEFFAGIGMFPWMAFLATIAVTGLIGYIVFRISIDNVRIRGIVAQQTESLRRHAEKLEASNRDLDDFAYIASHDLKEPLRGLYNYAAFLLEDYGGKLDEEGQKKLETIQKLSRRMESLIDTLLQYSRLSREALDVSETDVNAVLDDILETMAVWLKENRATVTIQKNLPRTPCDPVRVAEVFRNLITNAVKYNNKPIRLVEVGVEKNGNDGAPVFFVRDNGIGIPTEHQQSVFKIFKRLHGRDEYGGGTGSGLTIVKKIVDRHNGRVWLQSREGEGTTFFFTLQPATKRP